MTHQTCGFLFNKKFGKKFSKGFITHRLFYQVFQRLFLGIFIIVLAAGCNAEVSLNNKTDQNTPSDATIAANDAGALAIVFQGADTSGSVTQNISLPLTGESGSNVTWSSSDENVINSVSGAVARPAAGSPDAVVTLTATVEYNGTVKTATFTLTVLALSPGSAPSAPASLVLAPPLTSPGNDPTPSVIVGGVNSGDTVALFTDSSCTTQVASGFAGGSSVTMITIALSDGSYTFYANTTSGGQTSSCSITGLDYTLDTVPPSGQDTVLSSSSTVSAGSTLVIAPPGAGNTVWLAPAGTGSFSSGLSNMSSAEGLATSIQVPAVSGVYHLYVVDPAGNVSSASTATVTVTGGSTPPPAPTTLALVLPVSSPGNNATPVIRVGGVASGDTVSLFTDSGCTQSVASQTAAGTTIDLTAAILTEGAYTFYANTEQGGITSVCSTASVNYTLDLTPPALSAVHIESDNTNTAFAKTNDTVTVTITASEPISTPAVSIAGQAASVSGNGASYSGAITLAGAEPEGMAALNVAFSDFAGNTGNVTTTSDSSAVIVDLTAPANQDIVLATGATVVAGMSIPIVAAGTGNTVWLAPVGTIVFAPGLDITTAAGTDTAILAPATLGNYHIFIEDAAGNVSQASTAMITVDLIPNPPSALALVSPVTSPGNIDTPTIQVTGVTAGHVVRLFTDSACTVQVASGTAATTNIDLTTIILSDGAYNFYANADNNGLVSNCSLNSVSYTLDTIVPSNSDAVLSSSSTVTSGTMISISPAGGGNTVWLAPSGTTVFTTGTGMTSANGAATSIAAPTDLGVYLLYVVDLAGNISTPSVASITVATPPGPPTGLAVVPAAFTPKNDPTPTIRVSGVNSGYLVRVFTDAACMVQIAGGTAAGVSIDLTTITLSDGPYTFYANVDNNGLVSSCSTASASYTVDTIAPTNQDSVLTSDVYVYYGSVVNITPAGAGTIIWLAPAGTTAFAPGPGMSNDIGTSSTIYAPMNIGTYYIYVVDEAGNASPASVAAVHTGVVPSPPTSLQISGSGGTVLGNDPTPAITVLGGGVATGINVRIYTDNTCTTEVGNAVSAGGSVDVVTQALADGIYTFYATAANGGFVSGCSMATVTYDLNTVAPNNQDTVLTADVHKYPTFTFNISPAGAGNNVWVAPAGTTTFASGPTMTSAGGAATIMSLPSTHGIYRLFVVDTYGNVSAPSAAVLYAEPMGPSSIVRSNPLKTQGTNPTPAFTVSGGHMQSGAITRLYTDSICTSPVVGTATSTGTGVSVTTDALTEGAYNFYARIEINGAISGCGTGTDSYAYDITPPAPMGALTFTSAATGWISFSYSAVADNLTAAPQMNYETCYQNCSPFNKAQWAVGQLTQSIMGLAQGTLYYIYVRPVDIAGNAGAVSPPLLAQTTGTNGVAPTLTEVKISTNNAQASNLATVNDVISVYITGNESISAPTVTIAGQTAAVTQLSIAQYRADLTVTGGTPNGAAAINISGYQDIDTQTGAVVTTTTDASAVTIDTVAPAAPTLPDLNPLDDSGADSADDITNVTAALTVVGTAEAGSTVQLYRDGTPIAGANSLAAGGVWTFDIALAIDGTYAITAVATDATGNVSAFSSPLNLTIDTVVITGEPDLNATDDSGLYSTDNITNINTTTYAVTCENGATVQLFAGASPTGISGVCTGGTINLTADPFAADSVYAISARQTDTAGNTDSSTALNVNYDTTPPAVATVETMDSDANGKIDRYAVTFNEPIDDSTFPGYALDGVGSAQASWQVSGYTGVVLMHGAMAPLPEITNDSMLYLGFAEGGLSDTGAKPDVTTSATPQVKDLAGNIMLQLNTSDVVEADKAEPIVESSVGAGANAVQVVFSETMDAISAENSVNYSIAGLTVNGAQMAAGAGIDDTIVILNTSTQAAATPYTILVSANSLDLALPGNGVNPLANSTTFTMFDPVPVLTAAGGPKKVTLTWAPIAGATAYHLYFSTTPGVTSMTGTKIADVTSPYIQTPLTDGVDYYYVITSVVSGAESSESAEQTAYPYTRPLKTFQTQCWDTNGFSVSCAGPNGWGHDGGYQAGRTPNFTGPTAHAVYTADYTTTDNDTRLVWKTCVEGASDPACSTIGTINIMGADIHTLCNNLNTVNGATGYADLTTWRVPTMRELNTILNYSSTDYGFDSTYFTTPATALPDHWTSTTRYNPATSYYTYNASYYQYGSKNMTTQTAHLRCVATLP